MPIFHFDKFARTFDKTLQQYLKEIEDIFSNIHEDIEFFLKNNEFYWKRKKMLLGKIGVSPASQAKDLVVNFVLPLINNYDFTKDKLSELQKNNMDLENKMSEYVSKYKQLISKAAEMENKIYSCSVRLINSKTIENKTHKSKNEVKYSRNQDYSSDKDSMYNEPTDVSDFEVDDQLENENMSSSHLKQLKNCIVNQPEKTKKDNQIGNEQKKKKIEGSSGWICTSPKKNKEKGNAIEDLVVPSTSTKDNENSGTMTESQESEVELELKLDEDCTITNVSSDESEEEMFS